MISFKDSYNEKDLQAAIDFGGSFDAETLTFSHFEDSSNYEELLESLTPGNFTKVTRVGKGSLVSLSLSDALVVLSQIETHDWERMLNVSHYAVISVNNNLCDGAHRVALAYLFDVPVKIAKFKADRVDWSEVY